MDRGNNSGRITADLRKGKQQEKTSYKTRYRYTGRKALQTGCKYKQGVERRRVPNKMEKTNLILIYKKGDKNKTSNYRGITLLNSAYKIYIMILE